VYVIRGINSKVNTDMEFTLPNDISSALLEFRSSAGNVFHVKSLDVHHRKIRDYTGIDDFSFHWMRNLTVSALAGMGADITHLSAMLGHTDSSTIKKYLSLQRKTSTSKMNEISKKLLS
jgi:site-specific recombinase XerD